MYLVIVLLKYRISSSIYWARTNLDGKTAKRTRTVAKRTRTVSNRKKIENYKILVKIRSIVSKLQGGSCRGDSKHELAITNHAWRR